MSSQFIQKLFEREKEARASVDSYFWTSIGFGFSSVINLFALIGTWLLDSYFDLEIFFYSAVSIGMFFMCFDNYKKAKRYTVSLKENPHETIRRRPPYPWHWWLTSPTGR